MKQALKKTEFAKAIGVSPASVTAYVRKGLPVLSDGRIDLTAGKAWVSRNVAPGRGGWNKGVASASTEKRKRGHQSACATEKAKPSQETLDELSGAEVIEALNDRGVACAVRVALALGMSGIQVTAAVEIISGWIDFVVGDDAIDHLFGCDGPPFNREALKQFNLSAADECEVDRLIDVALKVFGLPPISAIAGAAR